jgi:peptidoglycan/LPS O-acetylase OafA/YrhL
MTGSAYRPEIDGLRAVAVLLVVVFHAFPELLPGGFVGVDVFFVISGFLISGIILKDLASGKFSLLDFYARRCRRIIPALLAVALAVLAIAYFTFLADDFKRLGLHLIGGMTFTSNFMFWSESGYFDSSADTKPFLHLWSLSVEEQFYLIWPLLIAFCYRRKWPMIQVLAGLSLVSLAWNLYRVGAAPAETFFLLPARLWELGVGGLLACGAIQSPRKKSAGKKKSPDRNQGFFLAAGLLGAAAFLLNGKTPYPGIAAVLPVAAAALFISIGIHSWGGRSVLASKPLVKLGLISYPLYLWHWPLLAIARITSEGSLEASKRAFIVLLSVVLAWLTYRFIERPVQTSLFARASAHARSLRFVLLGAASLSAAAALGWLTYTEITFSPVQKQMRTVASYSSRKFGPPFPGIGDFGKCFLDTEESFDNLSPDCMDPKGAAQTILLWGDSYGAQLYPGMLDYFSSRQFRILRVTSSSCPPVLHYDSPWRAHCRATNDYVIEKIRAVKPKIVLMQAHWLQDSGSPGFLNKLDGTIAELHAAGVEQVLVLGQLPLWEVKLPKYVELHFLRDGLEIPVRSRNGVKKESFEVDKAFKDHFANQPGARYVSLIDGLCNETGCTVLVGKDPTNDLIAFDDGHLTPSGARFVFSSIVEPAIGAK